MGVAPIRLQAESAEAASGEEAHLRRAAALAMEIRGLAPSPPSTAGLLGLCRLVDQQFEALQFAYRDPDRILEEIETFAGLEGYDPSLVDCFRRMRCHLPEEVRRGEGLPVESSAARHVFQALGSPRDYEVAELAAIALQDPVLAGTLIAVANSAAYTAAERITRVGQAVAFIGTEQARKVLLAAALRPLFASRGLTRLWAHSVNAARFCAALAGKSACIAPEDALLLGLLHDIGAMAFELAPGETAERRARLAGRGCPATYVERLLFGCDHGECSAEILARWRFPDPLVEAVRFHHQPERSPEPLTAFLYLAEFWSGLDEDLPSFLRVADCLSRTGLTLEDLAQTAAQEPALKALHALG